jgi:hypothetical protein
MSRLFRTVHFYQQILREFSHHGDRFQCGYWTFSLANRRSVRFRVEAAVTALLTGTKGEDEALGLPMVLRHRNSRATFGTYWGFSFLLLLST